MSATRVDAELTSADVAEAQGVTRETAAAWLRTGYIPGAYKTTAGWRVSRADYEVWVIAMRSSRPRAEHERLEPPSRQSRARIARSVR